MGRACALVGLSALLLSCGGGDPTRPDGGRRDTGGGDEFRCVSDDALACQGNIELSCERNGEFLQRVETDCTADGRICVRGLGCAVCEPERVFCADNDVVRCNGAGDGFDVVEECVIEDGFSCRDGVCRNLCDLAVQDKSYVGCEFYAVDLDNAALGAGRDASSQQYSVVVSNPGTLSLDVVIEANDAAPGEDPIIREVDRIDGLAPGDLEIFRLPRREVDGSSSNEVCTPDDRTCPRDETCVCSEGDTAPPCFCRVDPESNGQNDGTHSALTAAAYRVRSTLPIIAYQFNPLDNVGVFSNDASMLVPTSAISSRYTVVSWPQTIADADCDPSDPACSDIDFNPRVDDEDLRAFLTVVGTVRATDVTIDLGPKVFRVLPAPGVFDTVLGSSGVVNVSLGPFEVLNLETDGLNADFTGTTVVATNPVAVFTGSEASDAPRFESYRTRQCCADHLEEQLFGDETLGGSFMIARMPPRGPALNAAFVDPLTDSVAEVNEPEWVRVVALSDNTEVTTTLPEPDNRFTLNRLESLILPTTQDFLMSTSDGKPLAVLQTLPSQGAIGIPSFYPGGDPAIIAVPPIEQYRRDYVFLTPTLYAFDFVTITAQRDTQIELDGELIYDNFRNLDPVRCTIGPADGIPRGDEEPPPDQVVIRCQLSYPDVIGLPNVRVDTGVQDDGAHTLVATQPVGVVISGFDAFVSYAYAAGLNLKPIPR